MVHKFVTVVHGNQFTEQMARILSPHQYWKVYLPPYALVVFLHPEFTEIDRDAEKHTPTRNTYTTNHRMNQHMPPMPYNWSQNVLDMKS